LLAGSWFAARFFQCIFTYLRLRPSYQSVSSPGRSVPRAKRADDAARPGDPCGLSAHAENHHGLPGLVRARARVPLAGRDGPV